MLTLIFAIYASMIPGRTFGGAHISSGRGSHGQRGV